MGRIIIVFTYLSLSIIANAQNKQAYLWNIGNYLFDFNTNPVSISQLPKKYLGAVWHVNQEGEILLYSSNRNFRLYDRFDKALYFNGHPLVLAVKFFVPMPDNEDLVYCFNQFDYFVVDTRTNQITSHSDQHNGTPNFITVHDYNCKNIWIIYFNSTEAIKYQITNNGLQYITKTKLITTNGNIDDPLLEKCINLSLSRDCNYFSAICPLTNEAIFGNFDRSTVPQTGPYSITYTINSNRDTTIEKINTSWQIPHIPGTYQIKKITANGCEYYPTSGNTATIGNPMKPLTIKLIKKSPSAAP